MSLGSVVKTQTGNIAPYYDAQRLHTSIHGATPSETAGEATGPPRQPQPIAAEISLPRAVLVTRGSVNKESAVHTPPVSRQRFPGPHSSQYFER
jgi:hypothetical protein